LPWATRGPLPPDRLLEAKPAGTLGPKARLAIPSNMEGMRTTVPYYRSTYV
jgi:hypothetical protein